MSSDPRPTLVPLQRPLVSVVVATYNDVELTRQCLRSLHAQTYEPVEVVVVDNGSEYDVGAELAGEFPWIVLLRTTANLGFAGGYNAGMRAAAGAHVAVINNDAVADAGWIASMVAVAESRPGVGSVAPLVLDGNRPGLLDSCGLGLALDGMSRQSGRGRPALAEASPREVLAASGCACLYRAEALRAVGLFDESFFAYCEDVDLGLRLRRAGYSAWSAPSARVTHYYSMTLGKYSLRKVYWVERNHFWVALKNYPGVLLPLLPFATLWRYVLQMHALVTRSGEVHKFADAEHPGRLLVTLVSAWVSCCAGLPRVWRQRRDVRRTAAVSSLDMCRVILRFRMPLREVLRGGVAPGP
jgi:GT2 family glycosyltransferase